jgi:hypothetical protein
VADRNEFYSAGEKMNDLNVKNFEQTVFGDGSRDGHFADANNLRSMINEAVTNTNVFDMHTHLFASEFGDLNLWGVDELLNYHYLIAELFRYSSITYEEFWRMEKRAQADLIWKTLFVENTPLSEATRGVCKVLDALGLNSNASDLTEAREFFAAQTSSKFIDKVLKIAKVSDVVMTNDPLDEAEIKIWNDGGKNDERFHASLRLDRILNGWRDAVPLLQKQNYAVSKNLNGKTISETRRFLDDWIAKMKPVYLGVSLPDDFAYPEESARGKLFKEVIFPTCKEHKVSLSLMIGVRRQVNPALKLAGDGMGRADVSVLSRICQSNPDVKILSTFLSRENQHEICVAARKFSNLMPFGCWWFVNNGSIISEITRERIELLGTSFIPQHSDARILDQLIYKWDFSRRVIADALFDSYKNLVQDGRKIIKQEIERDVKKLFTDNFTSWIK